MSIEARQGPSGAGFVLRLAAVATAAGLISSLLIPGLAAAAKPSLGTQTRAHVTSLGTTSVGRHVSSAITLDQTQPDPEEAQAELDKQIPNSISAARVPSAGVPRPAALPMASATGSGFDGLSHFDQRTAGGANTQFSLEPPDQGLCVGNGFVVEAVNTAIRVRDTSGKSLTDPTPINAFFNLAPEIIRPAGPFGPFTSDPKCYYDAATGRFFLTALEIDTSPVTGDFANGSHTLIAVSQSSDPTGAWHLTSIDTTDDGSNGTPSHAGCPCMGDQPLIGADANGFYISNNEFPLFTAGFNGAQLYALSKADLESGSVSSAIHISDLSQAEGPAYSMQPTTTPPGAAPASANGGTEYFLSALDFNGTLDNRITLWALSNTASLGTASPDIRLDQAVLASEVYGQPPAMQQKTGSAPLDEALQGKLGVRLGLVAKPSTEHLNLLNSNDDRMNQTVYVGGHVFGAVNTVVKGPNGVVRTGIAWFVVTPSWSGDALGGSVTNQGYVNASNQNTVFPAIAATAAGKALMSFTIVGPGIYPSAGYVTLDASNAPSAVKVARYGVGPADGFTGEISQDPGDGGVERWGDYGAAVSDENGTIWFAAETINQTCTLAQFTADTSCGGTRTILANWGTYIGHVTP
jgi:hypothetical protein